MYHYFLCKGHDSNVEPIISWIGRVKYLPLVTLCRCMLILLCYVVTLYMKIVYNVLMHKHIIGRLYFQGSTYFKIKLKYSVAAGTPGEPPHFPKVNTKQSIGPRGFPAGLERRVSVCTGFKSSRIVSSSPIASIRH